MIAKRIDDDMRANKGFLRADDLALIGLLRSRFFLLSDALIYYLSREKEFSYLERLNGALKHPGLSDEDKNALRKTAGLINKWIDCRERMTLAELLNIIVEDTRLFALLNAEFSGEQRTANLQKVIELADNFDQSGPGGLRTFLDTIDDLINREVREGEAFLALDDRTSVKIMTIHVSKGLQFPVVFVPNLNKSMRSGGSDIMIDGDLGMAVTFKDEEDYRGDRSNENTLYRLLRLRQKQKDLAELKRIFYVAVSRASNLLFLSASCKKSKNSKISRDSMFELLTAPIISAAKDPFEPGTMQFDDFDLEIVTDYPKDENDNLSDQSFSQFLNSIEKMYNNNNFADSPHGLELVQTLPVTGSGRIFSATAVMTYIKDPLEYYNRYHLGFFEGDYNRFSGTSDKNEIDSLKKGKIVHRYLEMLQKQSSSEEEIIDLVLFENEIFDPRLRDILKSELSRIHQTVRHSEIGKSILDAQNFRNELSLTMKLGDDYFTGTIDRLQQNAEGSWEIIDYKTNKITIDRLEETGQEYDIQIKSYALLMSRLYPGQSSYRVVLYFLTIDKTFERVFSKKDVDEIEKYFLMIIREVKEKFPVVVD